ncbi:MAG: hypothetical protein ONB44_21615 [candidate division KSB1 bacterium]|nr:hypothetical protein [candidate division KSB1 bacterium]MDZ7304735.1 hypothetical protein [candidate division KSB1 bacterium]MDZ7313839.1 hypothetical protein [candidate division KSB1 bacterium]
MNIWTRRRSNSLARAGGLAKQKLSRAKLLQRRTKTMAKQFWAKPLKYICKFKLNHSCGVLVGKHKFKTKCLPWRPPRHAVPQAKDGRQNNRSKFLIILSQIILSFKTA